MESYESWDHERVESYESWDHGVDSYESPLPASIHPHLDKRLDWDYQGMESYYKSVSIHPHLLDKQLNWEESYESWDHERVESYESWDHERVESFESWDHGVDSYESPLPASIHPHLDKQLDWDHQGMESYYKSASIHPHLDKRLDWDHREVESYKSSLPASIHWDHQEMESYYKSSLPASIHPHLNKQLDWDHQGVDRDLHFIADCMWDWEPKKLSTLLELSPGDIHSIMKEYIEPLPIRYK